MDRSSARAAAMKLLYEWEMGGDGGDDTRYTLMELSPGERESDYMEALVSGVMDKREALDAEIAKYLIGWTIERLGRVDLTILRVAAYEMEYAEMKDAVAINEAVELARAYSTPEAASFVNGVLGNMSRARASR